METINYRAYLDEIYELVKETPGSNFSVLDGNLSNAVFYLQHHLLTGNEASYKKFDAILNRHIDAVAENISRLEFGYGFTGLAWLLYALKNKGLYTNIDLTEFDEIDEHVFACAMKHLGKGMYNYMEGGIGIGLYFLEKTESPGVTGYLEKMVQALEDKAVHTGAESISWLEHYTSRYDNTPRSKRPYFNLGIPHGIVSIIYFLARCSRQQVAAAQCNRLIQQLINWLRQQEEKNGGAFAYPNKILDETENRYPDSLNHKFSWCYGMLGIAAAYHIAGKILSDEELTSHSRVLATGSFAIDFEQVAPQIIFEAGIYDIYICHGMAGTAHLYGQLGAVHNDAAISNRGLHWLHHALHYFDKYKTFNAKQTGILNGLPGIGMILSGTIAAAANNKKELFNWSTMLLTDFERF
jgi:lantibiotic biosynthesis protein